MNDTIAAIATAPGRSLRAIVRMSGPEAFRIAAALLPEGPDGRELRGFAAPRVTLLLSGGARVSARALFMRTPHSYTTEDVVEFFLPGSPILAGEVLASCLRAGARLSGPGEFTRRAYLSGRIDAVQVEGVLALIESASDEQRAAAMERLRGVPTREAAAVRSELLCLLAAIEAWLDFTDEDTEALDSVSLANAATLCRDRLRGVGKALARRNPSCGIPGVVLIGPPNAGKSSLFSAVVPGGRAIVSGVPGTTRDLIEGRVSHGRRTFRLFDAPGILETEDPLERLALSNLEGMMSRVQTCVVLLDGSLPPERRILEDLDHFCGGRPRVFALNKSDRGIDPGWDAVPFPGGGKARILSARLEKGLNELLAGVTDLLPPEPGPETAAIDAGIRSSVEKAVVALDSALDGDWVTAVELVAIEIRDAFDALGGISAPLSGEELLDTLFSRFCIGK